MFGPVDAKSGDFPSTDTKTSLFELPRLIPIIADILAKIRHLQGKEIFTYCFYIDLHDMRLCREFLTVTERELPQGVCYYEADGMRIFKVHGKEKKAVGACFYLMATPIS